MSKLEEQLNQVIPRTGLWLMHTCGCRECVRLQVGDKYEERAHQVLNIIWDRFDPIRNTKNQTKERMKEK